MNQYENNIAQIITFHLNKLWKFFLQNYSISYMHLNYLFGKKNGMTDPITCVQNEHQ